MSIITIWILRVVALGLGSIMGFVTLVGNVLDLHSDKIVRTIFLVPIVWVMFLICFIVHAKIGNFILSKMFGITSVSFMEYLYLIGIPFVISATISTAIIAYLILSSS